MQTEPISGSLSLQSHEVPVSILAMLPRNLALLALLTLMTGCYARRSIVPADLARLEEPVICEVVLEDREILRARIEPGGVSPGEIRLKPCVFSGPSWEIRYSGWPAVYSSGKYWRGAHLDEEIVIRTDRIRALYLEQVSWFPTLITLPVTLPPGIVDLLVRSARLSFDGVNTGFDNNFREDSSRL